MKYPVKKKKPLSLKALALAEVTEKIDADDIDYIPLPESFKREILNFRTHFNTKDPHFHFQCDMC